MRVSQPDLPGRKWGIPSRELFHHNLFADFHQNLMSGLNTQFPESMSFLKEKMKVHKMNVFCNEGSLFTIHDTCWVREPQFGGLRGLSTKPCAFYG